MAPPDPGQLPLDISCPAAAPSGPGPAAMQRLYQTPGFWQGCITTREHLADRAATAYERADHLAAWTRLEALRAAAQANTDPTQLPEFTRWIAGGKRIAA